MEKQTVAGVIMERQGAAGKETKTAEKEEDENNILGKRWVRRGG